MSSAFTHGIIGAGPGGLAAARAFRSHGLDVEVLEAHEDVGGIWDQNNPGSPMYDSAHFISSRRQSGFRGFPMPNDFPDYPSHRMLLEYLRSFARAHGLYDVVRFGVRVERATPDAHGWTVEASNGQSRRYSTLTVATGTTWHATVPEWPGAFDGQIMHSSAFRETSSLAGRRVLVVGAGNSGVDIACDVARTAARAAISVRRGYHLVPKHVFGLPADEIGSRSRWMPTPLAQRSFAALVRLALGDPAAYGWPKPDHRLFESHPIVNDQIVHHLRHGDLSVLPDVDRLDGSEVVFADGRREAFEVIIAATGYRFELPFLDPALFSWRGGRPQLHLQTLSPKLPRFAAIGLAEFDGAAWPIFDLQADLVARAFAALDAEHPSFDRLRRFVAGPPPDLSGGVKHVGSDRHAAYVHRATFARTLRTLRRDLGWSVAA